MCVMEHDKTMRLRCRSLNIAPPLFSTLAIFLRRTTAFSSFVLFVSFPFLVCLLVQIMPVCPQCDNRSFSNKEALLQHMKSSSAWHPFCSICDRRFVSQPAFDAVSSSSNTVVPFDSYFLIYSTWRPNTRRHMIAQLAIDPSTHRSPWKIIIEARPHIPTAVVVEGGSKMTPHVRR